MVGRNRFIREYSKASKELRTGKKAPMKKKRSEKQKSDEAYGTGFLIGALKGLFRKK